ncbi:hypothetical protein HDU98_002455 [Podochytrium sp. JEL0797]|nr:hypothetical protein HDU98_002455 [Podochytrium sp. JEL0797]
MQFTTIALLAASIASATPIIRRDAATDAVEATFGTLPDCLQNCVYSYLGATSLTESSINSLCTQLVANTLVGSVTPCVLNNMDKCSGGPEVLSDGFKIFVSELTPQCQEVVNPAPKPTTTEVVVPTTEAAKPTTEAAKPTTTEAVVPTTEAAKPTTTEAVVPTTEAAKPTTTEAAEPTTTVDVVSSTTEAVASSTETIASTTEAVASATETIASTTKAVASSTGIAQTSSAPVATSTNNIYTDSSAGIIGASSALFIALLM